MMKTPFRRRAVPAIIMLLTCIGMLLSGCSSLGEVYTTEDGLTIRYPEGWNMLHEQQYLYFSPQDIDMLFEAIPLAIFGIDLSIQDEEALSAEPSELITYWGLGLGIEFDEDIETLSSHGIVWHRASFTLQFPVTDGETQGWLAVTQRTDRVVFALAFSPPDVWEDYEGTFEGMLKSIEFE